MTMQVAMVGNDGVVIASDMKVFRAITPTADQIGNVIDPLSLGYKIEYCSEKNIAISCAEDLEAARKVAKTIIEELTEKDRTDAWSASAAMQVIAEKVLDDGKHSPIRCLIALKCPDWTLITCAFGKDQDEKYGGSCEPNLDGKDVAGHVTNPATFLASFYDECDSVDELIPLASYLIVSANKFNSQGVEGLDVVRCDSHGVRRLSVEAIQQLRREKWDESIRNLFTKYSRANQS